MENHFNDRKSSVQQWLLKIAAVLVFVVIGIFGYMVWEAIHVGDSEQKETKPSELPRMANQPPKKESIAPPPPPSYAPDAPVLEQARKALRAGITPEEALALAMSLPESPERADAAFLLLEYAADSGNAKAALVVARYYDPTDNAASGTIRKNAEIAFERYKEALAGGQQKAKIHLAQLRRWVEEQAGQGSYEARELLNAWR